MSAVPASTAQQSVADADFAETREWMDALSAVIQSEGPERAHYLLEQLLEHARQSSIDMPFSANTGYVNTIESDQEEHSPGNLALEGRLRAYMRWNAMAMVVKANRHYPADGGSKLDAGHRQWRDCRRLVASGKNPGNGLHICAAFCAGCLR